MRGEELAIRKEGHNGTETKGTGTAISDVFTWTHTAVELVRSSRGEKEKVREGTEDRKLTKRSSSG